MGSIFPNYWYKVNQEIKVTGTMCLYYQYMMPSPFFRTKNHRTAIRDGSYLPFDTPQRPASVGAVAFAF
jgi:hypothetical protein